MPKDFTELISDPSRQSSSPRRPEIKDPNIHHNFAVEQEIKEKYSFYTFFEMFEKVAASCVLAPLLTIQVSLQLSVMPHKEKYHDTIQNEKRDIIKSPNPLTVQDKRRYAMVVKSGVTKGNMPFRAPVYSSYREVIKGLYSQGPLGFFKGNFAGSVHFACTFWLRKKLATVYKFGKDEYFWQNSGAWIKLFYASSISCLCDILFYPLMAMQSRFILQNRLPNFYVYKGFLHFFTKHSKRMHETYFGWKAVIPYNFILMLNTTCFSGDNILQGIWVGHNIGIFMTYPLLTIMRRLQCQTPLPGMIPLRYAGVTHCFMLMANEEGLRGFYRGFPLHFIISNVAFSIGALTYLNFSKYFYLTRID